jgi:2,4-dienoyl-CoA reductase-like NADH-dependent reductase (Old Yellow Enzyme family)
MPSKTGLDTPLQLTDRATAKNRFFKSAMSEQLAAVDHGPSRGLCRLYRTWAEGGVGLSVTGNVMIDGSALGEPRNVVVEDERHMAALRAWADAGTGCGTHLWMQVNHPGKQVPRFLCRHPVAPSAVPMGAGLGPFFNTPRALNEDEILAIVGRYAETARIAKKAGFTGVQIHGAHGYLVSQFLSPRHNRRADRWGGSAKHRLRFLVHVYRAIRKVVGPGFPVGVKLNSADYMRGGFTEEESLDVVTAIAEEGIDLIEVSGGTYESPVMTGYRVKERTRRREAYFLAYAENVRQRVDTPLVVTGGFRSGEGMRAALESGATDMVGLARPMAIYPDLPNDVLKDISRRVDLRRPTTGIAVMDQVTMLDITWYEAQLARMAAGRVPDPDLSVFRVVLKTLRRSGLAAFRPRRA